MKKIICIISLLFISCIYFGQRIVSAQSDDAKPNVAIAKDNLQQSPVEVPEYSEKAKAYNDRKNAWWAFNTFFSLLIPFLFLQTKASAKIRDFSQKFGNRWYFTLAIYFTIFTLANFLIFAPLYYYRYYLLEHDFGFSNQSFFGWLTEYSIKQTVTFILGCLFLWVPYLLLRKSPKRWWLYTSFLMVPFMALVLLVFPIYVLPLLDNFSEMKNKDLEAKVFQLANRAGIEGTRIYEVEKSDDTKSMDAYMAGIFNTKRIVLSDNIIKGMNEDELLFVTGHEMAHYVLGHSARKVIILPLMFFVSLFLIYKTSTYLTKRFGKKWGISELSDPAAMPLLSLVLGMSIFILNPFFLWDSRNQEHEAQRFALELTRNNRACATFLTKTVKEELSNPRPSQLVTIFQRQHPPLGELIDFCNEYKPWEKGEPLKYEGYFKEK
jgi:STE24 endopeptidase